MTSVTRNVFRRIENEMEKLKGEGKIDKITGDQFSKIRSSLINAKEWLQPQEFNTFIGFVKMTYNLSGAPTELSPEKVKLLYNRIVHYLERRLAKEKMKKKMDLKRQSHFTAAS